MKFTRPVPFEIPDDVWQAAVGSAPRVAIDHFAHTFYRFHEGPPHIDVPVELVPIDDIVPPIRDAGTPMFIADRLPRLLRAILVGDTLPAVLGQPTAPGAAHRLEIIDGFHRFYASAALGCSHVPVAVRQRFDG